MPGAWAIQAGRKLRDLGKTLHTSREEWTVFFFGPLGALSVFKSVVPRRAR